MAGPPKIRLNFYKQTDSQVRECVEQMQQMDTRIQGWRIVQTHEPNNPYNAPSHKIEIRIQSKRAQSAISRQMQNGGPLAKIYRRYARGRQDEAATTVGSGFLGDRMPAFRA